MTDVFVIRNQLGHYWGKGKEWVDGTEPKSIMRVKHEDEAVNTLFELSSRDFDLRGEVLAAPLTEKGEPDVEPSAHLLPKKEPEKSAKRDRDEAAEPASPDSTASAAQEATENS